MRRRITLIHSPDDAVDPSSVRVDIGGISGPELQAAREERLTFSSDELPDDVVAVLRRCASQLDVRWATSSSYEAPELLSSRISPGLHVFYKPPGELKDESFHLCSSLEVLFGELACDNADSFVRLPSRDGDGNNGIFQYYQPYEPDQLIRGLEVVLCASTANDECISRVQALRNAASVDVSYDSDSETLRLQALWPVETHAVSANPIDGHKTEVGVFSTDPSAGDAHELGVGGFLASTSGESREPSVHIFAVQSRHRPAAASFSAEFLAPQGLHPTLRLAISSAAPPPEYEDRGGCGLHAYLTLPRTVFADRYQLADDLFLASKNLSSLKFASQPVDLEMPEYKTPTWGSTVLLELAPPETSTDGASSPWTAEVPLHLRYKTPTEGGYADAQVPYPAVFWACEAGGKAAFSGNPWDRASLGYDALFGPTTSYWHVEPRPEGEEDLMIRTKVPVLDTEKSGWVEVGTAAAILVGFAWVLFSLFSAVTGKVASRRGSAVQAKKKK